MKKKLRRISTILSVVIAFAMIVGVSPTRAAKAGGTVYYITYSEPEFDSHGDAWRLTTDWYTVDDVVTLAIAKELNIDEGYEFVGWYLASDPNTKVVNTLGRTGDLHVVARYALISSPTTAPTVKPTTAPTVKPTTVPTVKPTTAPTVKPTTAPTVKPTTAPTVKPTTAPTVKPTTVPTVKPTTAPTVKPTTAPTTKPTATAKPTSSIAPTRTPVSPTATVSPIPTAESPTVTPVVIEPTVSPNNSSGLAPKGTRMVTIDGFIIVTNGDDTATLVGFKNPTETEVAIDVVIGTDEYQYTITAIGQNAFTDNTQLTGVTIGRYVAKIGKKAFYGCSNLKLVDVRSTKLAKSSRIGKNSFGKTKGAVFKLQKKIFNKAKKAFRKKSGAKEAKYRKSNSP